jgi:hypothetical protein
MTQTTPPPPFKTVSGRWVVIGLLSFGILATGTLWIYTKLDLAPFVPLIKALDREFPESKPQVKGGRSRRQPPLLRVVLQVDFTPAETDPRVVQIFERVVVLSKEHLDLSQYEDFELHIVRYTPEKTPEWILIQRKISEL